MLPSWYSLLHEFGKLYFLQIDTKLLQNHEGLKSFTINYFFFLFSLALLHTFIIYIVANLSNSYRHFRLLFFSVFYAIFVAFSVGKILETLFFILLNNLPVAGRELAIFNTYSALTISYILEIFLLKGKLKSLYDREKLGTELIDSDLLLGVTIATLLTILLFVLI